MSSIRALLWTCAYHDLRNRSCPPPVSREEPRSASGLLAQGPGALGVKPTAVVGDAAPVDTRALEQVQGRVLWLAANIVHVANKVRPNPGGIKVGGHHASSASMVTILTELFFDFMRAGDRISVKPHASPVLHAIHYLLGNLDRSYLPRLRELHALGHLGAAFAVHAAKRAAGLCPVGDEDAFRRRYS